MVLILIKLLFQGNHIKIYNVDNGWKVQKNILTKSLRWTITDTSLSPDQRYLVRYYVLSLK
jgi:WD repeat-containing protein 23